ncbi:hypothetical protein LMB73_06300 [Limosilactobacillus reuteri]|uniref:hypothetical protein n=1 Tax=Limosilactobacillus reuteri TaxID=1598 RepID=UPI001E3AFCBC|nr:hypothetical protein [Limosilactobacillus reuteri]MCC4456078.1 hypothetical protein [Limosilactobacillus reuteri]MCC4465011.1 hypothetical protein [Limosilactobacillus reuteri]
MKIDEFKATLRQLAYTTTDARSGIIKVYSQKCWQEDNVNGWCFQLAPARKKVIVDKQWDKLDDMPVFNVRDLLNLIAELEKMPVKERFPEKKYVLSAMRCAEGPVPVKQYVDAMNISTNNVEFHFGFANETANAMEFTQEDLDSLSDFFPKDAIDAMKEPAEDKNDETD